MLSQKNTTIMNKSSHDIFIIAKRSKTVEINRIAYNHTLKIMKTEEPSPQLTTQFQKQIAAYFLLSYEHSVR